MQKYLDKPLTQIRRKERVLDDAEWIDRFLDTAPLAHIAVTWEGQPLIHSNLYWYDGVKVYWHTAPVGKLRAILDQGDLRGCFTVAEYGRILPASTPFDFSTEYASVILYGTVRVVADAAEKRRALEGLMVKYAPQLAPGADYVPMPDSDIALTSVHCMEIDTRVGKHNIKPTDYPAYPNPSASFIAAERDAGRTTMGLKELA